MHDSELPRTEGERFALRHPHGGTAPKCEHSETWEPLVQDLLDGELGADQATATRKHLERCVACQQAVAAWAEVDRFCIAAVDGAPQPDDEHIPNLPNWATRTVPPRKPNRSRAPWVDWIPWAAAAAALIGIGFLISPRPTEITAEELVKPITQVQFLHTQVEQDQELRVEVLDLELRALRHELSLLETSDADRKKQLADSLDQLIERLHPLQQEFQPN